MAESVVASWDGHDYQARVFWIRASELRRKDKPWVIEVSYETDGPKGFDDVVVRYNPGRKGRRSFEIAVDHHQVKFHVNKSGRFGYLDLAEPEFIGATSVSILQRLQDAVGKAPAGSTFTLITTDRIRDDDPLRELVSARDSSIDVDKLREGKTPKSKMGKVRKHWREHLKLNDDDQLYALMERFHLKDGAKTLEEMRAEVDDAFYRVGLNGGENTWEFSLDGVIRGLKSVGRNTFTRDEFEAFVKERRWIRTDEEDRQNVSIRSFGDASAGYLATASEWDLSLLDRFDARHLKPGADWTTEVQPEIEGFLKRVRQTQKRIRLSLEAHTSIAFLAGSHLGMKTGTDVEVVQKSRGPTTIWRSDDDRTGSAMLREDVQVGTGADVAIVVSLSRTALRDVEEYLEGKSDEIGSIFHFIPEAGFGPTAVAGGAHAAALADQVANVVSNLRLRRGAKVHLFVAAPNGFTFFLGQHREAMGSVVLYEFDFGGTRQYHSSFRIG